MMEWKQRVQKLRRFDVETTQKNPCRELIDISSILKVQSTSKCPRRIDVIISTWICLDVISLNFPRGISTLNRWRINKDVSIGLAKKNLYLKKRCAQFSRKCFLERYILITRVGKSSRTQTQRRLQNLKEK